MATAFDGGCIFGLEVSANPPNQETPETVRWWWPSALEPSNRRAVMASLQTTKSRIVAFVMAGMLAAGRPLVEALGVQ